MSVYHSRLGVVNFLLVSNTTPFYCLLLLLLNVNLGFIFWIFTFMMLSCFEQIDVKQNSLLSFFWDYVLSEHTWIVHIAKIIDQNKRHCHLDFFAYLHANVVDMQTKQPDAIIAVTDSYFSISILCICVNANSDE